MRWIWTIISPLVPIYCKPQDKYAWWVQYFLETSLLTRPIFLKPSPINNAVASPKKCILTHGAKASSIDSHRINCRWLTVQVSVKLPNLTADKVSKTSNLAEKSASNSAKPKPSASKLETKVLEGTAGEDSAYSSEEETDHDRRGLGGRKILRVLTLKEVSKPSGLSKGSEGKRWIYQRWTWNIAVPCGTSYKTVHLSPWPRQEYALALFTLEPTQRECREFIGKLPLPSESLAQLLYIEDNHHAMPDIQFSFQSLFKLFQTWTRLIYFNLGLKIPHKFFSRLHYNVQKSPCQAHRYLPVLHLCNIRYAFRTAWGGTEYQLRPRRQCCWSVPLWRSFRICSARMHRGS